MARLSSGERHRLGLLRCLEMQPEALLLDEPTAALDLETTLQVEKLLRNLLTEGVTIIIVTHDPEQPTRMGCKVLRIDKGRVAA